MFLLLILSTSFSFGQGTFSCSAFLLANDLSTRKYIRDPDSTFFPYIIEGYVTKEKTTLGGSFHIAYNYKRRKSEFGIGVSIVKLSKRIDIVEGRLFHDDERTIKYAKLNNLYVSLDPQYSFSILKKLSIGIGLQINSINHNSNYYILSTNEKKKYSWLANINKFRILPYFALRKNWNKNIYSVNLKVVYFNKKEIYPALGFEYRFKNQNR